MKCGEKVNTYETHLNPMLATGSAIDRLLGGGFRGGTFYEVVGPSGVGKSQLLFTLAAEALGDVFFIDTLGTFRPERVAEIATFRGKDPKAVLSRIKVYKPNDLSSYILALEYSIERAPVLLVDMFSDPFYETHDPSIRYRLGIIARKVGITCLKRGLLAVVTNGVRFRGKIMPLGSEYTDPYVHIRLLLESDVKGNLYAFREDTGERERFEIFEGGVR